MAQVLNGGAFAWAESRQRLVIRLRESRVFGLGISAGDECAGLIGTNSYATLGLICMYPQTPK
jgi:hypothetical protein